MDTENSGRRSTDPPGQPQEFAEVEVQYLEKRGNPSFNKLTAKPASVRSNLTNLTLDTQPHPTLRIRKKGVLIGP